MWHKQVQLKANGSFSGQEGLVSDGRVGFLWKLLAPDGLYEPGLKQWGDLQT
jgi:hypothetical protein